MITKNLFVLGLVALIPFASFAQNDKKVSAKHVNWYGEVKTDTKDLGVELVDAQSMIEFAKFKLKLTNKTEDYILYKPQESIFKFESGDLKPVDKKTILIQPLETESRVIDTKGMGQNLHVDAYKFQLDGIYKVKVGKATEAPNFELPVSSNEMTAGNFKVEMLKFSASTAETSVKFKVTYTGDGMALVEPKKLGVKVISVKGKKMEDDKVYANDEKSKGFLLKKGESETFSAAFHIEGRIADMQFANMEIVWRETFKDCEVVKAEGTTIDLAVHRGLTAGKNK